MVLIEFRYIPCVVVRDACCRVLRSSLMTMGALRSALRASCSRDVHPGHTTIPLSTAISYETTRLTGDASPEVFKFCRNDPRCTKDITYAVTAVQETTVTAFCQRDGQRHPVGCTRICKCVTNGVSESQMAVKLTILPELHSSNRPTTLQTKPKPPTTRFLDGDASHWHESVRASYHGARLLLSQ